MKELEVANHDSLDEHNRNSKPFICPRTEHPILDDVARFAQRLGPTQPAGHTLRTAVWESKIVI